MRDNLTIREDVCDALYQIIRNPATKWRWAKFWSVHQEGLVYYSYITGNRTFIMLFEEGR